MNLVEINLQQLTQGIFINLLSVKLDDFKSYGEGVSRFASIRHCQTPSDTWFQEIGGNSPNISPNTFLLHFERFNK